MPQAPPDLAFLLLSARHLLLLLGAELHVVFVALCIAHDRRANGARSRAADVRARDARPRARVLKAVHGDGQVALVRNTSVCNVPLLRAERANKFFVMGNHDYATLVVADSNGQATERVAVQEVSGFVKHEQMGVVPHGTRCCLLAMFSNMWLLGCLPSTTLTF